MTSVDGVVDILDNMLLAEVNGLTDLTAVGQFIRILNNPNLALCCGLFRLLDANDDGAPGPGVAPVPDVNGPVIFINNQSGCDAIMEIVDGGQCPEPVAPVPTLSQWGVVMFGLVILILGIVTLYNIEERKVKGEK